jgi:hypothetical protein
MPRNLYGFEEKTRHLGPAEPPEIHGSFHPCSSLAGCVPGMPGRIPRWIQVIQDEFFDPQSIIINLGYMGKIG